MARQTSQDQKKEVRRMAKRVLVIGAGEAGEMVVREMLNHPEAGLIPVGLIDDDPKKKGRYILGVKVFGDREEIPRIVKEHKIDEVLISIPSAKGKTIRELITHCKNARVGFKIVPGLLEIIRGDVKIHHIREIHPEDLLGRQTVEVNLDEIKGFISGKRILITGAGGSIGGELCRAISGLSPELLVLLDHEEDNIYHLELALGKDVPFSSIICDIREGDKILRIFKEYRPQILFHAAAYKHVPLMEENPDEAVKNNIFGTENLLIAADKSGCERFIMISTDKAVNPTSVLGATKRVAELLTQIFSQKSKSTKFITVRFGNVIGSRGSVVPLFKKQIEAGGPLTVTHPEVVRYFMTIREASQLVLQASVLGNGGEVFVLDMGEEVKILELAQDMITLSGLIPDVDIKIEFIGLRPGEKLHEELLTAQEGVRMTRHEKIFIAKADEVDPERFYKCLRELKKLTKEMDRDGMIGKLKEILPEYRPQ